MVRPIQLALGAILSLFCLAGAASGAAAHAEPDRSTPPSGGTMPAAPRMVEIIFDEDLRSEGTTIIVIGPGGVQVDLGDAAVDLQDPERRRVTVSLRDGLGPGTYTVQWFSVSAADGDAARGDYIFHVGAGSPAASPAVTPGTPPASSAAEEATPAPRQELAEEGDFDSAAFGISVAAGVVAAVLIYLFWRLVRPKKPVV